ncbi:MAG TPA: cytochrome c-type biogenesis protein CcmH [Usitatibacteraceae bacterium]|nr:cytochrome c-type biogenesis protein CcmH [Usitatibacteraceae bacterium]
MKRLLALALAAALSAPVLAKIEDKSVAADPAVERRLKEISDELRCLVCQNQTISDSDAPLAVDLRTQIRKMIDAGKSDEEIRAYMVDRYGDFVLYRPPFNAVTALLWVGPGVLVVGGLAGLVIMLRRRKVQPEVTASAPDAGKLKEIASLLESEGDAPTPRR